MGNGALLFVCLSVLAIGLSVQKQTKTGPNNDQIQCYHCKHGTRGATSSGDGFCLHPRLDERAVITMCSGPCVTVHVEDEENDITYVQRGCLPGCRHNENYNVMDYGKGSMRCCVGDLCNHATGLRVSHIALATVAMVLGFFIFH